MKKIKELQLENFKFFTGEDNTLSIGGKNLLIWGENGSGKSSIYWAIFTLLQCSFKDAGGIDAYFTENGDKNLINIHAVAGAPSFVRMKLDDDVEYKIQLGDHSIINNLDIQYGAVSSDFIDYKVLLNFLSFYHRDKPLLFALFKEDIFRFLPFKPPAPFTYAYFDNAWATIETGLQKDPTTKKYPSKGSSVHDQYKALVDAFNLQLKDLLGQVTVRANKLLDKDFGYEIEIELAYTPFAYTLNRPNTKIEYTLPEIELKIKKYYGKADAVKKPHSFLNEAKKTAIGLAIRLGILERRLLDDQKLNLLALDDLLISLDMSNRQIVLKLMLEEYSKKYQLILFTHDKQFFNLTKRTIETQYKKSEWMFLEMYEDNIGTFPKPYFKPEKDSVQVSDDFLIQHDYPAAGIYLRKEVERLLSELLPDSLRKEPKTENGVTRMIDKKLNDLIIILKPFCEEEGIPYAPFTDLKTYKDLLLNPLAHSDNETPLFKNELKKLIAITKDLQKIKRGRVFLSPKKSLNFILNNTDGTYFSVRMKTQERLVLVEEDGKPTRISIYCKCLVSSTDNNGTIVNVEEQFDTVKEVYNEMCHRFAFTPIANISDAFTYDTKTFATRLVEVNT